MTNKTIIPIETLSIEGDGYHLTIKVKVNNRKAVLLIDTGASKTVFDLKRMEDFVNLKDVKKMGKLSTGLGTNKMQTHTIVIEQIKIGKLLLKNYKTILLDLSHVNSSYEQLGFPPIDGVLGSDLMVQFNAIVDYRERELKLKWKK